MCGIGVTSRISVTRIPTVWNARSADSRPEPGPFTNIAIVRMPNSAALRAASSAASWPANGVLLREPLKPRAPELDQDTTLPCRSVIVTIVLLNVDWMCAMPVDTFFLPRLARAGALLGLAGGVDGEAAFGAGGFSDFDMDYGLPAGAADPIGFLAMSPLRGPLRVRALVCVR